MSYTISGRLAEIKPTVEKTTTFKVRDFVLEVVETSWDKTYPQSIVFQASNKVCDAMDKHRTGDNVTVHFNLRGKEFNGKHYNTLAAWKVEGNGAAQPAPQQSEPVSKQQAQPPVSIYPDDLPW